MFQHLLFPTDGSDFARLVVSELAALVAPEVRVTVLHVFSAPTRGRVHFGDDWHLELEEARKAAQLVLDDTGRALEQAGLLRVSTTAFEGSPGPTICDIANLLECDAIAIGARGNSWLDDLNAGSVSSYVLRNAEQPVILLRPGQRELATLPPAPESPAPAARATAPLSPPPYCQPTTPW